MKNRAVKLTVIMTLVIMALYSWSVFTDYEDTNHSNTFLPRQDLSVKQLQEIINTENENKQFIAQCEAKETHEFSSRIFKYNMQDNGVFTRWGIFCSDYSVLVSAFLLMQFYIIKFVHCAGAL